MFITGKFRRFENLHILFWLVKDACWVTDFKTLGVIMIGPTLLISMWLSWKMRHDRSELAHNVAVTSWICANSVWMIGEFFYDDTTRGLAKVFFFTGLGVLCAYYLWSFIRKREGTQPAENS